MTQDEAILAACEEIRTVAASRPGDVEAWVEIVKRHLWEVKPSPKWKAKLENDFLWLSDTARMMLPKSSERPTFDDGFTGGFGFAMKAAARRVARYKDVSS